MVQKRSSTAIRRKQIVIAAGKLIVKYGSEHVTVRRIADEIGTSEGAIYRHFKSKRDILSLLVDDIEEIMISEIKLKPGETLVSLITLEKLLSGHVDTIVQRKGTSFQVIAEIISYGDKKLNQQVYDAVNKYIASIKDLLNEGVKTGIIRNDVNLDAVSTLFFNMMQGLVNSWALSQYSFDLKQRYASLWSLFRNILIKH